MDLRLLGPLEVCFEDGPVELGPASSGRSSLARPDGYPDVIDARLNVEVGEALEALRARRREIVDMGTGYEELARLRRRDPGLIHDTVGPTTVWVFLNTRLPPFDSLDARRAVSLVIDRRAFPATGRAARKAARTSPGRAGWSPAPAHTAHA